MTKIDHSALPQPGQVAAAEDVAEHGDQDPDPDEEQEEPEHRPEHLAGTELSEHGVTPPQGCVRVGGGGPGTWGAGSRCLGRRRVAVCVRSAPPTRGTAAQRPSARQCDGTRRLSGVTSESVGDRRRRRPARPLPARRCRHGAARPVNRPGFVGRCRGAHGLPTNASNSPPRDDTTRTVVTRVRPAQTAHGGTGPHGPDGPGGPCNHVVVGSIPTPGSRDPAAWRAGCCDETARSACPTESPTRCRRSAAAPSCAPHA